ncbi:hypothetical protein HHK36_006954 [Tetracentron sinense]|uniref:F-box domain-containing protein n=1 Tax=Tetracentron sinense TaxID=13715 RepID=A0A835DL78_TETSI|nr:hypothetical protein HHK36_006954 [Tetracentron sinense]
MSYMEIENERDSKVKQKMGLLPDDIMIQILSRLPVKTLVKFRCVCKLWLQLISDPHLFHLHSHRSKLNPLLFFASLRYGDPNSGSSRTLHLSCMDIEGKVIHRSEKRVKGDIHMLPSRLELVCLHGSYDKFYVCNPTTLEFITLPLPTPASFFNLNHVGFGYCPSTKEYKVVRIFCLQLPSDQRCQVFTLGSSSWRAVKDPPFYTYNTFCAAAFVDGALHWMAKRESVYVILAFDIETEEFSVVPYPENFNDKDNNLVELGGFLCLTVAVAKKIDIWMLKDYKNNIWVKEYSIDMNTIDPCNMLGPSVFMPRDIRDGKILIESFEIGLDFYNPQSKGFKRFEIEKKISRFQFSFYMESFRSLGSGSNTKVYKGDILILILSRLPVKTLSRFRCVCKLWLQLISDPHLLHLHSLRSKSNPLLFFASSQYSNGGSINTLHLSCMDMEGKVIHRFENRVELYIEMLPSSFELVCFKGGYSIYVCNPTTMKFITLPESPHPNSGFQKSVGFGYIPTTKEYKVVQISSRNLKFLWSAFVDGALHWTIADGIAYAILAFDIETEEFRVVPYPENFDHNEDITLVELGGLLGLTVDLTETMDIWMLKDYKNQVWVKEYSINLNSMDPYDMLPWGIITARDIRDGKILIESYGVRLDF